MHETAVALVEQLLVLSAQQLAGAKQRGRDDGDVIWHGSQRGVVALAERQLRVRRPRLRGKAGGEVEVPAYARLRDDANIGERVRDILLAGVSTRRYAAVLPQAAGAVGVSRSTVSRRFIEASAAQLAALNELRNVLERLPRTEAAQTRAVMTAAYKLEAKEGMAKLKKQAQWLEREHADVAASLLEGLAETFTINTLGCRRRLRAACARPI